MARSLPGALAVALLIGSGGPPAAAQSPPDRLGLGREFGAAVDPARAAEMIAECEQQVRQIRGIAPTWRASTDHFNAAYAAFMRADATVKRASAALGDAQIRLRSMTGAEAEQFRVNIVQARQEAYETALTEGKAASFVYEAARQKMLAESRSLTDFFRSIGMQPDDYAGRPDAVIYRQTQRCARLRAWAALGTENRLRPSPVQPSDWPDAALSAWSGAWTCQVRTVTSRNTMTATLQVRTSATLTEGVIWVRAWTATGQLPGRLFARLDVRPARPGYAVYEDPDGEGEDGIASAVVDTGELGGDGRLTLTRRYRATPSKSDVMVCARIGA